MNKRSERRTYKQTPCNSFIKDYTEISYMIYEENFSSVQRRGALTSFRRCEKQIA